MRKILPIENSRNSTYVTLIDNRPNDPSISMPATKASNVTVSTLFIDQKRHGLVHVTYAIKRIRDMAQGTVKWFNPTKGFGFIEPAEGGNDVFVHISAVERSGMTGLTEGQKVNYDLEQDKRSGKFAAANLSAA